MRLRFVFWILLLSWSLFAVAQQTTELSSAPGEFQISGSLVDADSGQPLAHANVAIAPVKARDDLRVIVTGDDGHFLFTGLTPGKYTLSAQAHGHLLQAFNQHDQFSSSIAVGPDLESTDLVFKLPGESSISGTVVDEAGEPVRDAPVSLYQIGVGEGLDITRFRSRNMTNDEGAYRFSHLPPGQYLVAVSARPWYSQYAVSYKDSGGPPAPGEVSIQTARSPLDLAYPITFSGGSTDAATATVIRLSRGERYTANINLQPVPALHLRTLIEEKPGNHGTFISLEQRVLGGPPFRVPVENRTMGSVLETGGLAPGHYTISTSSRNGRGDSAAAREIDVSGNTNLQILDDASSGSISATVQSDGAGLPRDLLVRLINRKSQQAIGERVDDQGQAVFKQTVFPGSYEVALFNNQGTYLKTLAAEGAKLTGRAIEIRSGATVKLKIGIGHGFGDVSGVVLRDGKPVVGTMVVLVPPDPAHNHVLFRRDQSDTDGTFNIATVVPGNYTLVAIEDGWDLEWMNPAVLNKFLARGVAVTIQPNGKTDVKVPVQ